MRWFGDLVVALDCLITVWLVFVLFVGVLLSFDVLIDFLWFRCEFAIILVVVFWLLFGSWCWCVFAVCSGLLWG